MYYPNFRIAKLLIIIVPDSSKGKNLKVTRWSL
jgi:hypothetical protein